jgi:uracil-DNA glycosylase
MTDEALRQLGAYVEYLRDLGVHDLYRRGEAGTIALPEMPRAVEPVAVKEHSAVLAKVAAAVEVVPVLTPKVAAPVPVVDFSAGDVGGGGLAAKLVSFNDLAPLPESKVALSHRADALKLIQEDIGDCTRCPLAYAGRRKIVFADGDPGARLMFVGEGPGADEDTQGLPFVGKAGQLLNNMISAMGLKREEVYIANIVKCRPPGNRTPEPVEANTCSQFLLRQMDVVQPEVVVALGATAATYLLGVKQSLAGLRGRWHSCRGAKLAVTYHPAFLLRDPRMKGEAWKDLQMVMKEMGLKGPAKG